MAKAQAQPPTEFRHARKMTEKRRGVRLNSRVPVAVEWENDCGEKTREKAYTCVVGTYGCLVILPSELAIDQPVRVVNLTNEQTLPGIVVWKGSLRSEGWELGVELTQPPMDFWGLDL
jgi:hypothetical protein